MIRRLALAAAISLAAAPSLAAVCPAIPFVFVDGTVIEAGQMNANFASVLGCFHAKIDITDTTPSTSTSTGALTVAGGVGIAGQLSVGGGIGGRNVGGGFALPTTQVIGPVLPSGIGFQKTTATSTDGNNVLVVRDAAFTGGTPGSVNAGLQVFTRAGLGITSYEWAGLFQLDSYGVVADGSGHTALYSQAVKRSTAGAWAATLEVIDKYTGAGPAGPSVGAEIDWNGNDVGAADTRVILHLIGRKDNLAGVTPVMDYALKIGMEQAFTERATYATGIRFLGQFGTGIDMTPAGNSFPSAAIWLPDDSSIAMDNAGDHKHFFEAATGCITFVNGGPSDIRQRLCDDGPISMTNGVVTVGIGPVATTGIVSTGSNHDLVLQRNAVEKLRLDAASVIISDGLILSEVAGAVLTQTDGTVTMALGPVGATTAQLGTSSAHDLVLFANAGERIRAFSAGGVRVTGAFNVTAGYSANGVVGVSCGVGTLNPVTAVVTNGLITTC